MPRFLFSVQKQGVKGSTSNVEVVQSSDVIFIAVKPHMVEPVLKEVTPIVTDENLFVSIAAGITLKTLEEVLGSRVAYH